MELDGTPTNITLPHKMFLGMDFYLWRWPEKEPVNKTKIGKILKHNLRYIILCAHAIDIIYRYFLLNAHMPVVYCQ